MRALMATMLLLTGCASGPPNLLERGERYDERGDYARALKVYDRVAGDSRATPEQQCAGLTGAALAARKLGDAAGARRRLERAIARDLPGAMEPALFYLAELIEGEDAPRAMSLYYRAAGGAEKYRGRRFPYTEAMNRYLKLSLMR